MFLQAIKKQLEIKLNLAIKTCKQKQQILVQKKVIQWLTIAKLIKKDTSFHWQIREKAQNLKHQNLMRNIRNNKSYRLFQRKSNFLQKYLMTRKIFQ